METWETCQHCDGSGYRHSRIEKRSYRCRQCAGFGKIPLAPGQWWFYRSRNGRQSDRIALLDMRADGQKLTVWDREGPVYHVENFRYIMEDLLPYRLAGPTAGRMLDQWSTRPAWVNGIKRQTRLAYWNLLHQKQELWEPLRQLCRLPLPDQLAGMARLKAKHFPTQDIW